MNEKECREFSKSSVDWIDTPFTIICVTPDQENPCRKSRDLRGMGTAGNQMHRYSHWLSLGFGLAAKLLEACKGSQSHKDLCLLNLSQ